MKCIKEFLASMSEDMAMTKQVFLLSVLVGTLAGIVFGMFFSPKKYVHIGCNNGNHYPKDTFPEGELRFGEDEDEFEDEDL